MKRFLLSLLLLLLTLPAAGATYYFSDCQSGAHGSCVAGDNSRSATTAQTSTTPWQTTAAIATHLGGMDSLPAGTVLRFARGAKWTSFELFINNMNATPTAPIVFEPYSPSWGGTAAPWFVCGTTTCLTWGAFEDTVADGGYTVRSLKLDGNGVTGTCVGMFDATRYITLDTLEISGCDFGVYAANTATLKNWYAVLRNSNVHNNSVQGILGGFHHGVVEDNTLANNAFDQSDGAGRGHNFYLGVEHGVTNMIVRRNTSIGPGYETGTGCRNGHITIHGRLDGLLLEDNTLSATSVDTGCGGLNLNPAYPGTSPPEGCTNCIVRGNKIIDAANDGIAISGSPGVIVENNKCVGNGVMQTCIVLPGRVSSSGGSWDNTYDDADGGAIIRNNGCYFATPLANAMCIRTENSLGPVGTGVRVVGNLAWFATASGTQTCWGNNTTLGNYSQWDGNLCFGADNWTNNYSTHTLAHAAGLDTWSSAGGLADNDPLFVAAPSSGNNYSFALQSTSPARNVALANMSRRGFGSTKVRAGRDTGPEEQE